ncbi:MULTISPECIES: electron transport complex subunit RsxG [Gammaproteobacteria]|uniref:electron transport complex subunit RsxG n=1 Tax=Gammaproteobacteria TaxID=1236 RepID=UPI001AD95FAD|nr:MULTISPECIES: electron transport complex subunit RsxG [Gammaproteobacteria]MBO9481410.1 electron transport complex subunit RsxG [Salinisphaera sp. G21_0]MBO9493885.1 electron transport complex subunit RsxG [Thalassotalea sp. G20_0]
MSDGQIPLKDTTDSKAPDRNDLLQSIFRNSLGLGLFAVFTVGLISVTWIMTQEQIETQVRAYEAKALMEILPADTHDNVLVDSKIVLEPSPLLSSQDQREAYIALNDGAVSAVILPVTAPDGYSGRIELLVGINHNGTLAGVRAITHKETPGLGDKINSNVTDWILGFAGKSLGNPASEGWGVKKDGGEFDQFTGATITPRAVVAAVYRALQYFEANRKLLLDPLAGVREEIQDDK